MSANIVDTWNTLRKEIIPESKNIVFVPSIDYLDTLYNHLNTLPDKNKLYYQNSKNVWSSFQTFDAVFLVWDTGQYGCDQILKDSKIFTDIYMMDPVGVSTQDKNCLRQLAKRSNHKFNVVSI